MEKYEEILSKVRDQKKAKTDRERCVLYLSRSLISDVRREYPETPVSRIVEEFLRGLVKAG